MRFASCVALVAAALGASVAQDLFHNGFHLASLTPGELFSAQSQPVETVLSHAKERYLFTYRSRGSHDQPITVSGYTLLPKGDPPQGGWPIMAWAHGTTGVADICALSSVYPGGPEYDYQDITLPVLDAWLQKGFAVVSTDYEGLGMPGVHTYINAKSQMQTVVDSVRAMRRMYPNATNDKWIAMGHSQGGAAALSVAASGREYGRELDLRGVVSIAPGPSGSMHIAQLGSPPIPVGEVVFLPILLLGAQAVEPSLNVSNLLDDAMKPVMLMAGSYCLSELRKNITKSPERVFKEDADLQPLRSYIQKQSVQTMEPNVPVLFVQGTADEVISPNGTRSYYEKLHAENRTVFYEPVVNGSHRDALAKSPTLINAFLEKTLQ
ncbi:hypothetical protein MVES1_003475 [Malassezia vespertilionis]|uniref:uncharacterized protein n=1 Tax=Malassezia vespertilionis TaxID=2020962 RepID=UPI0024B151F7|nr:uncharacterized protein MVES1_003474 [Malassezia vespertilionis]XP_056064267.1 uncharacterized protein MVES1_003475 [Malassezia vespertilionis]WFD08105.1 hypothetical protein MVES1_003474 [Malassezia vespertilionis]WFD08106.1 hypothetical protein MVES1_003475 [Malassezia vespertilionis]